MGHKNKKSLTLQVTEGLQSKLRIGESKHAHKITGSAKEHLFSWNTYKVYQRHCIYFIRYCRDKYHCKTLAQCRQYADEWLKLRIDTMSSYTVKLELSEILLQITYLRRPAYGKILSDRDGRPFAMRIFPKRTTRTFASSAAAPDFAALNCVL